MRGARENPTLPSHGGAFCDADYVKIELCGCEALGYEKIIPRPAPLAPRTSLVPMRVHVPRRAAVRRALLDDAAVEQMD